MSVQTYMNWMESCVAANISGITLGSAGTGKTALHRQFAKESNRPMITLEGAFIQDETYLQGIPSAMNGKTVWLPPDQLDIPDNAIIFIDDFPLSNAQHLLYALLLEKRIDTRQLPDTINIFAAGNRAQDGGVSYNFSPVLANRCSVNMEYTTPTPLEWIDYAIANNFHPVVSTVIRFHPEIYYKWNPNTLRNPTLRSWELCSKLLLTGKVDAYTALVSTVGEEAARTATVVVENANKMVDPQNILSGKAKVPKELMLAYITIANLGNFMSKSTTNREIAEAFKFIDAVLEKHSSSLADVAFKSMRKVPLIDKSPIYQKWVKDNKDSI